MKIQTAIVTKPLELGEYDESLRGQVLQVWVNPPKEVRAERAALVGEFAAAIRKSVAAATEVRRPAKANFLAFWKKLFKGQERDEAFLLVQQKTYAWLANILSQGEDVYSVEDIKRLVETDVVLYEFILRRSVEMMEEFRAEKKSPSKAPSKTSNEKT